MMVYPYTQESIHDNPELYMYAPFGGEEFLKLFIAQRKKLFIGSSAIKDALKILQEDLVPIKCVPPENVDIFFSLDILQCCMAIHFSMPHETNAYQENWLETFIRKYETIKKIWVTYDRHMKPVKKEQISIEGYIYFSYLLASNLGSGNGLKRYNCLLKLNDFICCRHKEWEKDQKLCGLMSKSAEHEIEFLFRLTNKKNLQTGIIE
jgi:hypothetical protein